MPAWIRWPQKEVIGEIQSDRTYARYPMGGGSPQPFASSYWPEADWIVGVTPDGRYGSAWRRPNGSIPCVVQRIDLVSGEATLWHTIQPEDATGMLGMTPLYRLGPSGVDAYAYGYRRYLQDLFLFEGLR